MRFWTNWYHSEICSTNIKVFIVFFLCGTASVDTLYIMNKILHAQYTTQREKKLLWNARICINLLRRIDFRGDPIKESKIVHFQSKINSNLSWTQVCSTYAMKISSIFPNYEYADLPLPHRSGHIYMKDTYSAESKEFRYR